MITENVRASYAWNLAESVSFIITKSPSVPWIKITIGFFNAVNGTVSGYVNGIDYQGWFAVGTQTPFTYQVADKAQNFGNGAKAMKYWLDTGEHYIDKRESVEIISPLENGEIKEVVHLANPQSLMEIF